MRIIVETRRVPLWSELVPLRCGAEPKQKSRVGRPKKTARVLLAKFLDPSTFHPSSSSPTPRIFFLLFATFRFLTTHKVSFRTREDFAFYHQSSINLLTARKIASFSHSQFSALNSRSPSHFIPFHHRILFLRIAHCERDNSLSPKRNRDHHTNNNHQQLARCPPSALLPPRLMAPRLRSASRPTLRPRRPPV
jgi:hypothetical protein